MMFWGILYFSHMGYRRATDTARLSAAVHERLNTFLEQQRVLSNVALEERIGA